MIWRELTHWPTHPPNHPPIHLSKGGTVSTNHKSLNRIELSRLDQVLLNFLWFHMFWPTNPPIHPSTHPPTKKNTHPWVENLPQIPNLQTESKYLDLFKSYCIFTNLGGYPPGGGWVGGWEWGWVWAPPTHMRMHMHMHACTCTYAHTCMHVEHDKHGCLHGGGHLQFPNMFILVFRAYACMHMHVHMSRDTPHAPRCTPTHLPPPQSRREPQGAQITKSL